MKRKKTKILSEQMQRWLLLSLLALVTPMMLAQVSTWKGPDEFTSDSYYQVTVNGTAVDVYDTDIASYAIFDFEGAVEVTVNTRFDVRWVDVRPSRHQIVPTCISDHSFKLTLKEPAKISLELNGRIRQQPLFLFASRPESVVPDKSDKNVIWFETGKIHSDVRLELQDHQTVYIEGGAVVQGYIFAKGKKDVKIMGRGILDGTFVRDLEIAENRFIQFKDCEDILVQGITLHNGTTWQVALFQSKNAQIENVKIVSENPSDDGIDLVQCQYIKVSDCFIHTKDDCVAIKSGHYKLPIDPKTPTDNITVEKSVFWNSIWGNAVEIGFELYTEEVKNITFKNLDILHVEDGAALSIHNAGPARVHNILFENIRIEDARQKLFDVAIFYSRWSPDSVWDEKVLEETYLHGAWDGVQTYPADNEDYHRKFRGTIDTIVFKNIEVVDGYLPFSVFHGFDKDHPVSNVTIENFRYQGQPLNTLEKGKIRAVNTNSLKILSDL